MPIKEPIAFQAITPITGPAYANVVNKIFADLFFLQYITAPNLFLQKNFNFLKIFIN